MPKETKKKAESKEDKNPKEDSELESLIDEEKFKELAEEISEEPDEFFISNDRFSDFVQINSENSSPSLEQVAEEQELGTRFFATGSKEREGEEGAENIYATKNKNYTESPRTESNQTNYEEMAPQEQGTFFPLTHTDISEVGRDLNPELRSVGFSNSDINESKRKQKVFDEYKVEIGRADQSRTTRSPFERQDDKKYKPRTI